MKKILFAIAIVMMLGMTANAQGRDGFFNEWGNDSYNDRTGGIANPGIGLPSDVNMGVNDQDPSAPLGTGLLILTALGAGYAVARKKK